MKDSEFTCSRRTLLRGAAIATATSAAGALLAACATEEEITEASQAQIPVGGAVIIGQWIVAQPKKGTFSAYSTDCTHAHGRINHIDTLDGKTVAVCPKHFSKFDVFTGEPLEGPARDPLHEAKNIEQDGDNLRIHR